MSHPYGYRLAAGSWSRLLIALVFLAGTLGTARAVTGNIAPNFIEIDGSPAAGATTTQQNQANLYPTGAQLDTVNFPPSGLTGFLNGPVLNAGATLDWVKDALPNTDTASYVDAVAVGIDPTGALTGGVPTGAVGGKGHWNGVRIVDIGINGDPTHDDIFTKGGKENLLSAWATQIAPGSIGGDKYNFTQGYVANNNTYLFAAFERAGTNGTTAFDLEFNKLAPDPTKQPGYNAITNPNPVPYVPNRSQGDILFTFEAHGSGGSDSGTVTAHYFTYDATTQVYVEQTIPAGTYTSTNNNYTTKCEPWGHVNFTNAGIWDYTNLARFELAEVAVPLSVFGDFSPCNSKYYSSIRTRASATDTSDLKDAGPIFQYSFGGPTAVASITPLCDLTFSYSGAGSKTSNNVLDTAPVMTYSWQFQKATGVLDDPTTPADEAWANAGTATGKTGQITFLTGGTYRAILTVTESATCTDSENSNEAVAIDPISAVPFLTPDCDLKINYGTGTVSGGTGGYTYAWSFKQNNVEFNTSSSASGSITAPNTTAVTATLTITDSKGCQGSFNAGPKTPIATITANPVLTPLCDREVTFATGTVGGGTGGYTYAWTFKQGATTIDSSTAASGSIIAPTTAQVTATLVVTDSKGCTNSFTANATPNAPLAVSAVKTSADGTALSVLLTGTVQLNGSAAGGATLQWERQTGPSTWDPISGANSSTLTYSNFENDASASAASFSIGTDQYQGKVYAVSLRLYAYVMVNGDKCEGWSSPVTVKKAVGVDP